MNIEISPAALKGKITARSSKSYAHRLLIAAFLSGGETAVECDLNKDVLATAGVLGALGADVKIGEREITLKRAALPKDAVTADCGESGSTLRFLMPLAAALGIKANFTGAKRLLERPLAPLVEVLNAHGADIKDFTVRGKLEPGKYEIDASLSSQYVTGLLFALTALKEKSEIVVRGERVSAGYIAVTLEILKEFGADITETDSGYKINSGAIKQIARAEAEGDWSNAAFLLAAGAIGGEVSLSGLNPLSVQGDREIISVLKNFGASVTGTDGVFAVKKAELRAVEVDMQNIPDLAQIIAVTAAFAKGRSVLKNVDRLRLKESDRIEAIINTLAAADIRAEYSEGNLFVYGGAPKGGKFCGGNDHRTVMSAAVLAANAAGGSVITGAEAAEKSYPKFFNDFNSLGGKSNVAL